MIRRTTLLVTLVWALLPLTAWAQAPAYIPIQGFLTDSEGAPIDGDTTFTISLYVNDMDGEPVFIEEQVVLIEDGFFTLYLGQIETLDMSLFSSSAPKYLGIKVGTEDEMTPRLPLGSVPYAAYAEYAGDAQTLQGHVPSDFRMTGEDVEWTEIANPPTDADTLADLGCSAMEIPQ
jgi:hypothetical protein